MITVQLLVCAGMIASTFLILGSKSMESTDSLFAFLLWKESSTREDIRASTGRKKTGPLKREIMEAQTVLEMAGRSRCFPLACTAPLALLCTGGSIIILLGSFFMAPVLAVGFMFLPFWYMKPTASHYRKGIAAELETALSVVTATYLHTEDTIIAVGESIAYLSPPVSKVLRELLMQIKLVNPDAEAALRTMKSRIDNEAFREWRDVLCDCQHDHNPRTALTPIIAELSDMCDTNAELEYLVAEPRKELLIMVFFAVGSIPLIHLLNQEWYGVLMHTPLGQIIPAVIAAVVFIPVSFVAKLTHPIEHRR